MATLAVTNSFSAGTTIVAADMNENFDDVEAFVNSTPGVVQNDIVDAKGDIIAATAADAVSRLAVGTDTYVLTADSGEATGLIWAAPTTGDITGLTAGTNIDISSATGPVPTIDLAVDAALVTGVDGTGVDVTFHSATAGDYMLWDASEEKLIIEGTNAATALDVTDGNVSIGDGTLAVSGAVTVGTDGAGADVTFHSGTAGDYALWDASEEKLILEGTNAATVLDVTDGNVSIGDGTLAVSGTVTVGTDGAGADVTFHSATAGDNFLWDASDEKLVITGTDGANALEVADGNVEITDKLTVTGQIVTHLLVSTESGTTHAPALGDENAYILTTHGTGITVTLPQNSAQAFAIGTTIYYERNGAGTLTFAAGTGASITSKDSTLTCGDRYTTVCALKIGTNAWSLIGNLG